MTGLRARLIVRLFAGFGDPGFEAGLVLVEFSAWRISKIRHQRALNTEFLKSLAAVQLFLSFCVVADCI
jgi:hypothetical protein